MVRRTCGAAWSGLSGRSRPFLHRQDLASVAVQTRVERELIDLDLPAAHYWPAFGQAGKSDIAVHLVLSHRSRVAALDEPVTNDEAELQRFEVEDASAGAVASGPGCSAP